MRIAIVLISAACLLVVGCAGTVAPTPDPIQAKQQLTSPNAATPDSAYVTRAEAVGIARHVVIRAWLIQFGVLALGAMLYASHYLL